MAAEDCACVGALSAPNCLAPSKAWNASCRSSYDFLYNSFHSGEVFLSLASRSYLRVFFRYSCEANTDLVEVARRVASERGGVVVFDLRWASSSIFM